MTYLIYLGEEAKVFQNGNPILEVITNFGFPRKILFYKNEKLILKATQLKCLFYRSIKIQYQDLKDEIKITRKNISKYFLLYDNNELCIETHFFKSNYLLNNKIIGEI